MHLLVILILRLFVFIAFLFSANVYSGGGCNYESIKTPDILNCAQLSYKNSDAVLNEQYKIILSDMSAENKSALINVQRNWVAFKESHCKLIYESIYPGVEANIDRVFCLAKQTVMRINELVYMRTGVESDGFSQSVQLLRGMSIETNPKQVQTFLENLKGDEDLWGRYARSHCQFMGEFLKEDSKRCMARMRFQML